MDSSNILQVSRNDTTMFPPTVVEQQAKLGVSAEESKAQRLKRQQARFRDRGGAFVPSNSNPLVDILLARTVSGESPSKVSLKNVPAKRLSTSKARRTSQTRKATATDKSQVVAGSSKAKPAASRKGKAKAVESAVEEVTKPTPKRRATTKGKKKAPDPDSDTEPPPDTKTKSTSKGRSKQRTASSSSNGNAKPRTKAKPNPVKEVVEVLVSDGDETLVEVPRRIISNPKGDVLSDDDDVLAPPPKKGRTVKPASSKRKPIIEPEPALQPTNDITDVEKPKAIRKRKQVVAEVEEDDDRLLERRPKPEKWKKNEGNYDDRPRKVVKFATDTCLPHSSSQKLKENQSDGKRKRVTKEESESPPPKLAKVLVPTLAKTAKGPPRDVLERIKASAAQYLRCVDSEPDELDCLS